MLPTKMLVINLPTLSQTRKQVFGFDLRLGLSQFVICKSSAKFPRTLACGSVEIRVLVQSLPNAVLSVAQ